MYVVSIFQFTVSLYGGRYFHVLASDNIQIHSYTKSIQVFVFMYRIVFFSTDLYRVMKNLGSSF